ncbi:MAG: hypothetical protein OEU94_11450 [Aquincola sp.]|nr:hypothetical protein [Aquincola sp.]MDH5330782.1 hypothetical protein [Aquincola sp.]
MATPTFVDSARRHVPRRTAEGQAELSARERPLTRRQRTVLFLIDGRRNVEEILTLAEQAGAGGTAFAELVSLGLVAAPGLGEVMGDSSVLPSSQSLQGDSNWAALDGEALPRGDVPLNEARALLVRAVRSEAPLAGALTIIKLKRAATREALAALLDEVEQRLKKPHRRVIAAQTLRHVRHLLTLPIPSRLHSE